jgi:hypothetical protein
LDCVAAVAVVEDVFDVVDLILKETKAFGQPQTIHPRPRSWYSPCPAEREARHVATATGPSVISPLLRVHVSVAPHNQQRKRNRKI